MKACTSCAKCKLNPRLDCYQAGCEGCKARALAATGAHIESQERGALTKEYRAALEKVFGADWKKGAAEVKRWASAIDQAKAAKAGQ